MIRLEYITCREILIQAPFLFFTKSTVNQLTFYNVIYKNQHKKKYNWNNIGDIPSQ